RDWIWATGRQPAIARPIAEPAMTPSDSGVSITRFGYLSYRPSVARNTPPVLPTSSPMISMRSSRSISTASAWLTASTTVASGIAVPVQTRELAREPVARGRVHLAEVEIDLGRRLLDRLVPRDAQLLAHVGLDLLERRVVDDLRALQVALHAQKRIAVDPLLVHLARLVARWIVCGRVQPEPVRHRLDERRPLARARSRHRVTRRRVHREQ